MRRVGQTANGGRTVSSLLGQGTWRGRRWRASREGGRSRRPSRRRPCRRRWSRRARRPSTRGSIRAPRCCGSSGCRRSRRSRRSRCPPPVRRHKRVVLIFCFQRSDDDVSKKEFSDLPSTLYGGSWIFINSYIWQSCTEKSPKYSA